MKTRLSIWREPIFIGACIIAVLGVIAVYIVGGLYFKDDYEITPVENVTTPTPVVTPPFVEAEGDSTPVPQTTTAVVAPESEEAVSIDETKGIDTADTFFPLDIASEEGTTEVRVSPYGFGPYPEVPVGFPDRLSPVWTWPEEKLERIVGREKSFELMHRVLIKLWNQGNQDFVGVSLADDNGKVYPTYPNVAYVIWSESKDLNGKVRFRYPAYVVAGPNVPRRTSKDFSEGRGYPPHVTVLDRETAGIDPYQFLGLQRR